MIIIPALLPAPYVLPKTAETGSCPGAKAVAADFPALLKEQCQLTSASVDVHSAPRDDIGHANTCKNAYILGIPFECRVPASLNALAQPASVLTWIQTDVARTSAQPPRARPSYKPEPVLSDFNLFKGRACRTGAQ
ncbi:hypothetical protein HX787_30240 [Pseudomonas tolaasii]|uniref:Uncharacterized protein n=1 Tax=Pseudomonas tolaasii TaxID=29442 RepID=A0A7Y8AU31_PSETO|nr:hypothetical protein [Pseudomonas tolaasii]KAB0466582.1 hypothetical protein F7R12_27885 [Pseudomonas tolaasii]MBY8943425.1 hypothetical protein [Pseudomonas tolaasii]NVZ45480.1 hypothetical protein [Pseudomonas tolaasii]NWA48540.1 hypothetical protein [Pseudomonas tolaasii]NWC24668.1 hypothetical protein [Pseudomonas tolaasii]